jgi:hypothetical protein
VVEVLEVVFVDVDSLLRKKKPRIGMSFRYGTPPSLCDSESSMTPPSTIVALLGIVTWVRIERRSTMPPPVAEFGSKAPTNRLTSRLMFSRR